MTDGQLEADRHRPDLAVVDRDDLHLPLAPERDRLLPVDDLERLVGRVQEERLLHATVYCGRPVDHVKRSSDHCMAMARSVTQSGLTARDHGGERDRGE